MFRKSLEKKSKEQFFALKIYEVTLILWFHRYIFQNEIIKMGWLLHCNTGCLKKHKTSVPCSVSLKKHKTSVPCSVLLSHNFVIVKETF